MISRLKEVRTDLGDVREFTVADDADQDTRRSDSSASQV